MGVRTYQERKRAWELPWKREPLLLHRLWIRAWSLASLSPEFTPSRTSGPRPTPGDRLGQVPELLPGAALQMAFSVSISPSPVLSCRPCPSPLAPGGQGLSCSSEARVPSAGPGPPGDGSRIRGMAAHQAPEEESWLVLGGVSVSAPFAPLCAISVGPVVSVCLGFF